MSLAGTFFRQLFSLDRPESPGDRLHLRMVEAMVVAQTIGFVWTWAGYISRLGRMNNPLGVANWIDLSILFTPEAPWVNAALVTVLVLAGFTKRGPWWYLFSLIFFHLQYVARFSQGSVGHGSNLAGMALLCFAVAAPFYDDISIRRRVAFGLALFFIGLGYLSAAVCKLVATGIIWPDGIHLHLWMAERSVDLLSQRGSYEPDAIQQWLYQSRPASTLMLSSGLLTELAGVLLWFRRTRFPITVALLGMHAGILLVMKISFLEFMLILMVAGLPWNRWTDRWLERHPESLLHALIRRTGY